MTEVSDVWRMVKCRRNSVRCPHDTNQFTEVWCEARLGLYDFCPLIPSLASAPLIREGPSPKQVRFQHYWTCLIEDQDVQH